MVRHCYLSVVLLPILLFLHLHLLLLVHERVDLLGGNLGVWLIHCLNYCMLALLLLHLDELLRLQMQNLLDLSRQED